MPIAPTKPRIARPLPPDDASDLPRARTMPPRLSHLLSGRTEEKTYSPREKARLISRRAYPPYAPMYRLLAGRSVRALAQQVGMSEDRLSRILKGRVEPWFFTGLRIVRALGITPEALDHY